MKERRATTPPLKDQASGPQQEEPTKVDAGINHDSYLGVNLPFHSTTEDTSRETEPTQAFFSTKQDQGTLATQMLFQPPCSNIRVAVGCCYDAAQNQLHGRSFSNASEYFDAPQSQGGSSSEGTPTEGNQETTASTILEIGDSGTTASDELLEEIFFWDRDLGHVN
jgi:hypothetical protein